MSSIGYASGGGLLTYSLAFDYDLWLGAGVPSGDCHQFTDQLEAQNFAENTLYPSDTPAATLIDTTSLNLDSTGHHSSQGSCKFKFPGIRVGAREAMILVSFTVPVEYKNDYIGNTILHEAVDRTWYIVKDIYYRESSADYIVNFQFTTSDDDISSAFCSMYVSEADALTAASLIGATTPQVLTAAPTTVSGSLNTAPVTVVTSNPTPSGTAIPVIIPHTARSNIISGFLIESQEMRNQYVDDNCLWKNAGVNLLQCVRLCLADDKCVSAFHHAGNATCTGHHVVYGSGNSVSGVSYYVFS
ncbi:uncharacterized protein LOC128555073 [Mercenaria mercenaria]|uniref:uncharacterized protein LOC128555073 n=1 Tax=Mercenaria mercenaria TaxID=6596 RepID=UPI00234E929F|nr:uncharacterized protein LOC128555073 [Mercenaria mercenaria]